MTKKIKLEETSRKIETLHEMQECEKKIASVISENGNSYVNTEQQEKIAKILDDTKFRIKCIQMGIKLINNIDQL
jgi:hypothetical protein